MKLRTHSRFRLPLLLLGLGALIALMLCVQCVRTYLYAESVLIPQQAEREAERQAGALSTAARSAGITDPRALEPVLGHVLESASERVLWIRVIDPDSTVLVQGGKPQGTAKVPEHWWERVEKHENVEVLVNTPQGKALVMMLPFRLPRPPHTSETASGRPPEVLGHPVLAHRPGGYVVEVAIPLNAVAVAFEGLRQNLIVGIIASVTLLVSLAIIGLRTPHYLRGKYLESELQLARRVQADLQPKPQSVSHVEFGALSVTADHVGGDFHDIFEVEPGKIAIVLGDVSGKGVSAALLVSVLQGAIRSSTASQHERACERINSMLCERTACERFATLFWAIFEPANGTLRYVNAGHPPPMLVRQRRNQIERLAEGGPVLGLLPDAKYSTGVVRIESSDTLVLCSDGITEATNRNDEEFGEARLEQTISANPDAEPGEVCDHIMNQVTTFAHADFLSDDRTLVVVKLHNSDPATQGERAADLAPGIRNLEAVA